VRPDATIVNLLVLDAATNAFGRSKRVHAALGSRL
jgi:hypothetical protein